MTSVANAGKLADELIAKEVAVQDAMWGDTNERADSTDNQMLHASRAQLDLVAHRLAGVPIHGAVEQAKLLYPKGWDGFRSYGSYVAELVVATAFLRSEIKRRILLGEDTTRTKRGEPYVTAHPYKSSEEVLHEMAATAPEPQ